MKMKGTMAAVALMLCLVFLTGGVSAQAKQTVKFAHGTDSAIVKGTVRGYEYRDYLVSASAGQMLTVRLLSSGIYPVLTVFKPDGDNLEGASETDMFSGELPDSGRYVIRVGMMRSAARRKGSISNYSLKISIK